MKIGVVGPIWLNVPPSGYGGTEEVVYNLVSDLVAKGHDVTLFGPETAKTPAKLIPTVQKPLREMNVGWTNNSYTLYHLTEAFDLSDRFDILHVQLNKNQDYTALPLSLYSKCPVVFTIHFRLPSLEFQAGRYRVLDKYRMLPFTSISNSQRGQIKLNYVQTVYNSLDITQYPYSDSHDDYFAWLGRINPVKGTHIAIQAAKKAGVSLKVMGMVDKGDPAAVEYFHKEVEPLIDGKQIELLGEVNLETKVKILSRSVALLNPIQWEEPFGLVMIESQAVGTPVISFNHGAATEIITDGVNGYLVSTLDEMVEKMKTVATLDRKRCRENVEKHFSVDAMGKGYLEVYNTVRTNWDMYKKNQFELIQSNNTNL